MFGEQKLSQFMEVLSSNAPTPGGGSASALSGAIGAALVAMVANLTLGKKKYEDVTPDMERVLESAVSLRREMEDLIEEDARSFDAVMTGFKMPKDTEEEKKLRRERIEEATKVATRVPLEVMRKCLAGLELCAEVAEKGNKNSISDAGVAALQFEAGAKGAMLNVLINLPGIGDEEFRDKAGTEAESIHASVVSLSKRVLELVRSKM